MNRVVMLGIDAMDAILVDKLQGELPNISALRKATPALNSKCVFPPDTPTAWASIYTGLNPARHGVIYFVDPLEKISLLATEDLDNTNIRGRTFWDIAGRQGKKVCIIFPQLGYPAWNVNGVMIGRSNRKAKDAPPFQVCPSSYQNCVDLGPMATIKALSRRDMLLQYASAHKALIQAETNYGLEMLRRDDWDLFFLYSVSLDWAGHNLWSYADRSDPEFREDSPLRDTLKDFYKLYDGLVGRFLEAAGRDTVTIVFSDHGQMRRPSTLVNINELLRREGLLAARIRSKGLHDRYYAFEMLKKKAVRFVNRRGAGAVVTKLVHTFPAIRKAFTAPASIDWQKTVAYVSDLSGIKAYPYGGIMIARDRLGARSYEDLRDHLVLMLKGIKDPGSGQEVVEWACRREDLYQGEYVSRYPDVVFQTKGEYGSGWAIFEPLLTKCETHNIQPGSHRGESPVFFVHGAHAREIRRSDMTLIDIAPTVLDLLGVQPEEPLDGVSIFGERGART